jgi:AcrR family transcriptional regulator
MARPSPAMRLDHVVAAATTVFTAKGYRRTQMADVARELGASAGNLYNYVESKDVLFELCLRRALDGDLGEAAERLPVRRSKESPAEWLRRRLDFSDFPAMEAALDRTRVADPAAEVAEVVLELHDVLDRVRPVVQALESSIAEMPELAEVFLPVRRDLFARMERYVESRVELGVLRPLADPGATARLVVELASWTANRRHRDPDSVSISDERAREALVDLAVNALVPHHPRGRGHEKGAER